MKSSKISPAIIAVIGVVACLIVVSAIYFAMIKPTDDAIAAAQSRYDAASPDASPSAQSAAKRGLEEAKLEVVQNQAQWNVLDARLMPRYDVSQRLRAWRQLSYEYTQVLGPSLEKWIPKTGVIPLSSVSITPPPASPNDIPTDPIVIPMGGQNGAVTVGGDFRRILSHVLQWNNFNRLVMIDNLALHDHSPFMRGTYAASVIIFPQNNTKPGPPLPKAGNGGVSPGGGGGFGGGGGPQGSSGGYPGGGYPGG